MSKWFKAALVAAVFCQAPVASATTQSLAGAWEFRAVFEELGCIISGDATLTATTEDSYDVALSAVQTCGGVSGAPVGQRCAATRVQDRVSIRCTIVQLAPGVESLPDDFELAVHDADTMVGLLTANWNAPAVWRRHDAAPAV